MQFVRCIALILGLWCFPSCSRISPARAEAPDISSVPADLAIPTLDEGEAAAGKRVRQVLDGWDNTDLYHVLYLPRNYKAGKRFPLIVEFAGNGGYRNQFGDVSDGVPEGSKLGYGISGGEDFVWLCVPFVTGNGQEVAKQWWGSPPDYSVENTVQYLKAAVASCVESYQVDPSAIVLAGFSRGAIATNLIGLHDDEVAELWCGMVAYSHYDGVRDWGLPGADRASAKRRLSRLGMCPQFICHEVTETEKSGLAVTREWLDSTGIQGDFTFQSTGFRNHNDAWTLRDSPARFALRKWIREIPPVSRLLN